MRKIGENFGHRKAATEETSCRLFGKVVIKMQTEVVTCSCEKKKLQRKKYKIKENNIKQENRLLKLK